jgi:hypothetical protein
MPAPPLLRLWRDPAAWLATADGFAVLTAFSLPWSTSLVGIFVVCWLVTMARVLDYKAYFRSLKRPSCALPLALFALAVVGTLWSGVAWGERLYAIAPAAKLLVLPGLFYHFQRSSRGIWVLIAFLVSCMLLAVMSWVVASYPAISLKPAEIGWENRHGIFVKNYIDQGQEFALCVVALAYPIVSLLRAGRILPALALGAIALSFVANMAFVIVSRTAMVTMPILLAIVALLHLQWRTAVIALCAMAALAGAAFAASPNLRMTAATFLSDYQRYEAAGTATSLGTRIQLYSKSLRFIADAPVAGHGTGSIRSLFASVATGREGDASALVFSNPHNQTLNVAIQWGVIGIAVLYAMWLSHLLLFRGEGFAASVGLLVVLQNMLTSLFNSHLFDFHEGWMYVLGVGVAGGMLLRAESGQAEAVSAGGHGEDELPVGSGKILTDQDPAGR